METWDTAAINLAGQGHVTSDDGGGVLALICVNLCLDRRGTGTKGTSHAFAFVADDEGHDVSGSGTARLVGPATLAGNIHFHHGDKRGCVARRSHDSSLRRGRWVVHLDEGAALSVWAS